MPPTADQALPISRLLDLSGRVIVVTGGSRGIGAAIAARLIEAGATVVVAALDSAAELRFDVSSASEVERAFAEVVERNGRLDGLVNCAGIQPQVPLLEQTAETWDAMMSVNARGVFLCTKAAAGHMTGTGGTIVNIASIESLAPAPNHSHYCASKAAVVMHTRAAALELGPYGIRVNAVSPGLIGSETLADDWPDGVERWLAQVPLGRLGQGGDIADAVLFLSSPMSSFVTGANLVVDGGILTRPTW